MTGDMASASWRKEHHIHSVLTEEQEYESWFKKGEPNARWWRNKHEVNWRTPPAVNFKNHKIFNRMDNRERKNPVVQEHATDRFKYCPGDHCNFWLPLTRFAKNPNMPDGIDIYCIECNKQKREQHDIRRKRFRTSAFKETVEDAFEVFQKTSSAKGSDLKFDLQNRAFSKIQHAIDTAQTKYNENINVDSKTIYDKLFAGNRVLCTITKAALDVGCFLDHHSIEVEQCGKVMDVNCTFCRNI